MFYGSGGLGKVREDKRKDVHQFSLNTLRRMPSHDQKDPKNNDYGIHDDCSLSVDQEDQRKTKKIVYLDHLTL